MFDGNGNWTSDFSAQADRDNGIKILASRFDNIFIADIKESFENCLTKDGQITPIGNFNMGGQKITNVGNGTNDNDAVNKRQIDTTVVHLTGDETITGFKTFKNDIFLGGVAGSGQEGGQINFNAGESETNQNVFNFDRNGGEFRFFGVGLDGNVHVPFRISINNNLVYANPSDVSNTVVTTTGISKSENGFVKLGNGIIIQWGRMNTTSTSECTVTFPIPFSSASSYTIVKNYQSTAGSDAQDREVSFYSMTSTSAKTYSPQGDTNQFSWLAIGY